MAESSFVVKYDGLPHGAHSIDVTEYAQSLLGMAEMLRIAQKTIAPEWETKNINLTATNKGSVESLIELYFVAVGLFSSAPASALANASAIVPAAWSALKKLRHFREPKVAQPETPRDSGTTINAHGHATVNVYQQALIDDSRFRAVAPKTLDPLLKGEAETIDVYSQGQILETFDQSEAQDIVLALDSAKQVVGERVFDTQVVVAGGRFVDNRLFVGFDEGSSRWADVRDPDYAELMQARGARVENGELLTVTLRVVEYRTSTGRLSTKWYIEKVHDVPSLMDGEW